MIVIKMILVLIKTYEGRYSQNIVFKIGVWPLIRKDWLLIKQKIFFTKNVFLPTKKYIFGKTNLLLNQKPILADQWPHTDFKHNIL